MHQEITIVGYLGSKPELRYAPRGIEVTTLNVATSRKYKDKTETTWFSVSVWGENAVNACKYLDKGRMVLVRGRLVPDAKGNPEVFQLKDGSWGSRFVVNADLVKYLGGKGSETETVEESQDGIPF